MPDFDFQLMVIGAGPGGYAAALRGAQLGMKVVCIDKREALGGTCLNVGCIPSKALLQMSEEYHWMKRLKEGHSVFHLPDLSIDFPAMMQRKQQIVNGLVQDTAQQLKRQGIEKIHGEAQLIDSHTVAVSGKKISSQSIILAAGSEPISLPFLPFDDKQIVSSTGALSFDSAPDCLLVIGAGAIGLELASVYRRLGSRVIVIEMMPAIVSTMDHEISRAFLQLLKLQGIEFYLSAKVIGAERGSAGVKLSIELEGRRKIIEGDRVLVAVGRRAAAQGLGLDRCGIKTAPNGMIEIDNNFRTSQPHIYAIGDLVEGPMLAHKATHEGIAAVNCIAGLPASVNYAAIPNVVYTYPEAASVGFTEKEAQAAGIKPLIGKSYFRGNPRARCAGTEEGFVKVIGESGSGRLIGMHLLSAHASEMIAEGVVSISKRATLRDLAHAMHPHPTLSEAIMEASYIP